MRHFIADLHLGHDLVADLRGFASVAEHDEAVLTSVLDAVGPGDQLWILGDLSTGSRTTEDAALEALCEVPDEVGLHLIAGNHDSVWPGHRQSYKRQKDFLDVFDSVQAFARARIDGRSVMLSHFPFTGDHSEEDRCVQYRLRDEGLWLVHGHTHSEYVVSGEHPRQLCVSWEAWGRPASEVEIAEMIKIKEREAHELLT